MSGGRSTMSGRGDPPDRLPAPIAGDPVSSPIVPAGPGLGLDEPLTERAIRRLGAPRAVVVVAWAGTAIVAPIVLLAMLAAAGESDRVASVRDLLLGQAAVAIAVVVCLWGAGRLHRGARALRDELAVLTGDEHPAPPAYRWTIVGPIMLTAGVSALNTAGSWGRYGPVPALAILPLLAVSILGIMTFVWTYLQLLVGLDRLGRAQLALDPFPQDRSLGLKGVGSLAFMGFVVMVAAALPILVTSTTNLSTVVISLGLVGVVVAVFFLSMWRLHRQMAAAKARYVAQTRALYAEAYRPLRGGLSVESLGARAPELDAARSLVERAERLLVWPVDEGMTAWIVIIVTGVVTSVIVRLIFAVAGL